MDEEVSREEQSLTSTKHPAAIYVDHSNASERTHIRSSLSFIKNATHKQQDVYSTFEANQTSHLIASVDFVGKKRQIVEMGNIYHEVDQVDVETAGANANASKVDDARKYLESLVDSIVSAASKPGASIPKVKLVGHASYTAHDKIDRIKDAQGNVREIPHNEWLAEQRALNAQKYMEKVAYQKYPKFMKEHPNLFSTENMTREAKGDRELLVATKKESNPNRRVSVQMETQAFNDDERLYRVFHLKKEEAQGLIGAGVTRRYDLAKKTSLANALASSDARVKIPARGSLLIEDVTYTGTAKFDVTVAEPDDFRVLVPKSAGEISYAMNPDGKFGVYVKQEGEKVAKKIAEFHVTTPDGKPIKAQHVRVASVDWSPEAATSRDKEFVAKTAPARRDVVREEKLVAAHKTFMREEAVKAERLAVERQQAAACEAEAREQAAIAKREQDARAAKAREQEAKEHLAIRTKILHDIDKDGDGVITKEERLAYQKIVSTMRPLGADGRTELTAQDIQRKIGYIEKNEDYKKQEKEEKIARYKAMLEYIAPSNGGMSVSKEQMTQAIKTRDEFDAMLREGQFQPPAGGALTVAQVLDKSGNKTPIATTGVGSSSASKTF